MQNRNCCVALNIASSSAGLQVTLMGMTAYIITGTVGQVLQPTNRPLNDPFAVYEYLQLIPLKVCIPFNLRFVFVLVHRCRSSRGDNLDSVGAGPTGTTTMDAMNGKISRQQNGSGREYWGRMPEPPSNGHAQSQPPSSNHSQQGSQPPSPTSSRKDRSSPGHSRKSSSSSKIASSRSKGVPQGFGYVKKTNGATVVDQQGQSLLTGGRTAHVSAVPRSGKLKVSGGTQTTTADFQASE